MDQQYCMSCMKPIEPGTLRCPHCKTILTKLLQPGFALPLGYLLHQKYLVGKVLGQGGFGITYIGLDESLDLRVAIKEYFPMGIVSRSQSDSSLLWNSSAADRQAGCESFVREARKMAKIDEIPNVVRVRETFFENGTAYIVMDYVEGETLKERLARDGTMDFPTCIRTLMPIMVALEKAHAQGIIHRDISPDNIMLKKDGGVRLLDLGAAKDLGTGAGEQDATKTSRVVKQGFSPLEQYTESGHIGAWTDVYALCATICYTVTGKLLPAAPDRVYHDTLDLSQGALPPEAARVLARGLSMDDAQRYPSVQELRQALLDAMAASGGQRYPESQGNASSTAAYPGSQGNVSGAAAYAGNQGNVSNAAAYPYGQNPYGTGRAEPFHSAYPPGAVSYPPKKKSMAWLFALLGGGVLLLLVFFFAVGSASSRKETLASQGTEAETGAVETSMTEASTEAEAGFVARDYTELEALSLSSLISRANAGDADAQYVLGDCYYLGNKGVSEDNEAAAEWYRKSAEQGNEDAQASLGYLYQEGMGVEQDYTEAVYWYQKSVENGQSTALNNLGYMYEYGLGVSQDYAEALRLYQRAAEGGNPYAMDNLAYMYLSGDGVEKDDAAALEWFQKAADLQDATAQEGLGYMYENGYGVEADTEKAIELYRLAASQGDEDAIAALERLGVSLD